MKDDDKNLLDAVVQKHSPWIQKAIRHLRGMGKIGSGFSDDEFYNTGYNAIVEALSGYDKEKGSFKTHAQGILKHRILRHIEKEMSKPGGGGVDPHFLQHARQSAKQEKAEATLPPVKEEKIAKPVEPAKPKLEE